MMMCDLHGFYSTQVVLVVLLCTASRYTATYHLHQDLPIKRKQAVKVEIRYKNKEEASCET